MPVLLPEAAASATLPRIHPPANPWLSAQVDKSQSTKAKPSGFNLAIWNETCQSQSGPDGPACLTLQGICPIWLNLRNHEGFSDAHVTDYKE